MAITHTKKTTQKSTKVHYEPAKMTFAISVLAVVCLVLFGVIAVYA